MSRARHGSDEPDSRSDLTRLRSRIASDPVVADGLDVHCLLVEDPLSFGVWTDCPPRIGEPFARDGSEHEFCLLDSGAVLLYTPLADEPYLVVGADLREFLSLLLDTNGTGLGALAYDWDATVAELASGESAADTGPEERAALNLLTAEFGLVAWSDHRGRLGELRSLLDPA